MFDVREIKLPHWEDRGERQLVSGDDGRRQDLS